MAESRHSRVRTDVFHVIARVPKTPSSRVPRRLPVSRVAVFRGLVQSQGRRVIHHLLGQVEDLAGLQIPDPDCGLKFLGTKEKNHGDFFLLPVKFWNV